MLKRFQVYKISNINKIFMKLFFKGFKNNLKKYNNLCQSMKFMNSKKDKPLKKEDFSKHLI